MKLTTITLAVMVFSLPVCAQPAGFILKKDEVSLKEGRRDEKKGFVATSKKEKNNTRIKLECGTERLYGYEISNASSDTGHFELSNRGTCPITATVETLHVQDDSGTMVKEQISLTIKPGRQGSMTFPIRREKEDKHTFILVTIRCGPNEEATNSSCSFIQNLTVGTRAAAGNEAPKEENEVKALNPDQAKPPGTTTGGSAGSKCTTPDADFVELYRFYNALESNVDLTFTVVNESRCEKFIARIFRSKFQLKTDEPLGGKELPNVNIQNVEAPAKNNSTGESGSRTHSVRLRKQEAIVIRVGCAGANNNPTCKGRIKDIRIVVK